MSCARPCSGRRSAPEARGEEETGSGGEEERWERWPLAGGIEFVVRALARGPLFVQGPDGLKPELQTKARLQLKWKVEVEEGSSEKSEGSCSRGH